MGRLPNGTVVFMRDEKFPGIKTIDIKITNTFPLITLTEKTYLLHPKMDSELLVGYDHISLPPDLRLHITGKSNHLFFDVQPVRDMLNNSDQDFFHYFTVIGLPASRCLPIVPLGGSKTWFEGIIISPKKDTQWNLSTRLFLDFYLSRGITNTDCFLREAMVIENMRLATDMHGSLLGPYSLSDFQRKEEGAGDIQLTIRFGYVEMEENDSMYIHSNLNLNHRRTRLNST